jgi:probable rRNA maturation factor
MARRTQNEMDEIAPSEVSVSTARGVRLPKFHAAEFVDFAAEACDRITAASSRKPASSRVDVLIANNPEMRRLNREFRHKDTATDVISFPAANNGHALQGDIAISAEITVENARRLGHSVDDELKILILHGMLHLAGYDHETDKGKMAKLEAQLRHELDLPGSLIGRESRGTGRLVRSGAAKRSSPQRRSTRKNGARSVR